MQHYFFFVLRPTQHVLNTTTLLHSLTHTHTHSITHSLAHSIPVLFFTHIIPKTMSESLPPPPSSSSSSSRVACFELSEAVTRITQHNFKRIVCQFPDHYLHCCTEVYLHLATRVPPECDIFIAADSTFGSSVDDISAAHVEADLLIFFGSDLSGSGSVNVMIIPPIKTIDIKRCVDAVATIITTPLDSPSLLVIDPCYLHEREALLTALQQLLPNLEPGQLPSCLGLPGIWAPASSPAPAMLKGSPAEQVGGVYFSTADVSSAENVIYIGEKEEQLATLFLRLSQQRVLRYSPLEDSDADGLPTVEVFQGDTTRVFRERYGGVSKVKDAKIVGLLVGSMGIETLNLQTIVKQLQLLVEAAGKKFYVFVLGRINEAKLCNFPEIDLFCLISNDDNALIPPKSFHVPVITPFELELGLGARQWTSAYLTSCTSSYLPMSEDGAETSDKEIKGDYGMLEEFATRLRRVEEARANRSDSSDSDSDSDDGVDEAYEQYVKTFNQPAGEAMTQALALLEVQEPSSGGKLIAFESPAAEYLAGREFQGLSATTEDGKSTKIAQGQFGIASEYSTMDK